MRKFISISTLFSILILGLFFYGIHRLEKQAQAQTVIEVACQAGQSPLQAFTTRNPSTGGIRQYGCVDLNGVMSFNGTINSVTSVSIPGVPGGSLLNVTNPSFGATPIFTVATSPNRGRVTIGGTTPASVTTFNFNISTVANLPSASSNTGSLFQISDSTAIATEGQTCAGGSSTIALAFSDGTQWKCF